MNHKRGIFVLALVGSVTILISATSNAATWQDQMLSSLNMIRAEKGLDPLMMCKSLTKSAQDYARYMATQNFYAHEGRDGSTPGSRIQRAGYEWRNSKQGSAIAENIAAGQNSVVEVMKGWRTSKSHYKNMVNPEFIHVGFGMTVNERSRYKKYWVQNLGFGANC
jgi:uncharacterized protein YkwD